MMTTDLKLCVTHNLPLDVLPYVEGECDAVDRLTTPNVMLPVRHNTFVGFSNPTIGGTDPVYIRVRSNGPISDLDATETALALIWVMGWDKLAEVYVPTFVARTSGPPNAPSLLG